MGNFLKSKWYWIVGGIVGLYLAMKLFSSRSSSGTATVSGTDPYAAYSSPSVIANTQSTDAALQIAQIQANSGIATAQIAGNQAIQQATIAEHANENTNAANVNIAQIQSAQALAVTNSNNAVAMHVSDNNLALGLNNNTLQWHSADLANNLALNNNSLQWHAIDQTTNLAEIQSGNQLSATRDTNATQLAELQSTNAAKLAAFGIQAGVANNQTAAQQQIADAQITANQSVQSKTLDTVQQMQTDQLNAQSHLADVARDLLNTGQINLNHGTSVTEQGNLDALMAILNPAGTPYVANAAASQANANAYGAAATTPNWASIANSLSGLAATLFG